ncbi:MAG: tyrosine-type recombinase/integrase [Christensenellales bacterium]
MNVLREAKRKQNEMHLRAGSSWHNEYNMIFTRSNGMFVRFKTLYVHFKAIVKQMGRPEVRFHDVRHTYATLSLQSHVDPKTLSEALGHATVAFTLDVYGHSNADMRQQAADQLERLICQY